MQTALFRARVGKLFCLATAFAAIFAASSVGQSLNPAKPFPMKAGANRGTVDNFVGANYFYFWGGPGDVKIRVRFSSMTLLGNTASASISVVLFDDKKTWTTKKVITSTRTPSEIFIPGTPKEKTKIIVALVPPSGGLVRTGGDYEVEATGAVQFDPEDTSVDPVVGVYTPKVVYENENGAAKFASDGTLVFASGTQGTWKVFDADSRVYTVAFGNTRLSLKLILGRGLVDMNDQSQLVFQRTK
jgi:hypothetical protein